MGAIILGVIVAFGSAVAGAILGAYLQKRWTPDLSTELAAVEIVRFLRSLL